VPWAGARDHVGPRLGATLGAESLRSNLLAILLQ
jgi:hypothetical protein